MSFSFGEVLVLLAVGGWAFGPKELPRVARTLGRLTGRATGALYKARAQVTQIAERAELDKVQKELQATMYQLQAIRSELQGGINILDPGPVTRRVLGAVKPQAATSAEQAMQQDSAARQQQEQQQVPMQAPTTPPLGGPAAPHTQFAAAPSFSASSVTAAAINAQHMASTSQQGVSGQEPSARASARPPDDSLEMVGGVPVIPVSAAQAGLLPERKGEVVLASELLFDAVQEERVAHQAQAFFQANTHARMPPET